MTVVWRFGVLGRLRMGDVSGFLFVIDSMGSVVDTCNLVKVVPDNSLVVKVCLAITRHEVITGYYTESETSDLGL